MTLQTFVETLRERLEVRFGIKLLRTLEFGCKQLLATRNSTNKL